MTTFVELINHSQPGILVQHLFSLDAGGHWIAGLALREDRELLAKLPARIDILSRGAVIHVDTVHLIVLMLQIEGHIYETFVSQQHEDSAEFIARMASQDALSILCFDGLSPQPARAFFTANGFQVLFKWVSQAAADWPLWNFEAFDRAKDHLYARYPTVQNLWNALEPQGGSTVWQLLILDNN